MPSTFARAPAVDTDKFRNPASKFGAAPVADVDALARGAAERITQGDGAGAFALADRRCRLLVPTARDLFLRAQAHRAAGRLGAAQRDLAAALALDPTDPALDAAALAWGDGDSRLEAAERVAARGATPWRRRRQALELLFDGGLGIAHGLRRDAAGVSGWIAWTGGASLRIEMAGAESRVYEVEPDPDHPLATAGNAAAEVAIEAAAEGAITLILRTESGAVERFAPSPPRPRTQAPAARASEAELSPCVNVIVPVYEDYEATRACVESLERARPAFEHRILVVDDDSPNPQLRAYLDAAAAEGRFELLRNECNLGFAASVNKALTLRERGDVLLLNADALLPAEAVARLRRLSRSQADVGAVTPFSNNGELTSYPLRNEANPMPSADEVARLDALARQANGDALVDIPNGVGFCLYITESCLNAVGALPELYAQGYYEDVEFCLAARERGFRNVAAPGIFVGHAGSRSFAARKRALVARNLQLIESRFPGYRLETAAFVALDPLAPFRAALDARLAPGGSVRLVAAGPGAAALARRRAEALARGHPEATVLTLIADARGGVSLAAVGGGAPQSLRFDFDSDGAAAFADYFARLDLAAVEWLDPASLPEAALSAMIASGAEIDMLCADLGWFAETPDPPRGPCAKPRTPEPCAACRVRAARPEENDEDRRQRRVRLGRALERARAVVPLDRLSESFAARVFKARAAPYAGEPPPPRSREGRILRLGVLYPQRAAAVDRLLLRLGRRLAREDGALVVFGASLDDSQLMATGSVFVTGPVAAREYVDAARDYGVEGLLGPDRSGGYGDLEAAASALGLAQAYFDWSFGAFPVEWGDLSLDPRICDDKAAALIVAWMNGERTN